MFSYFLIVSLCIHPSLLPISNSVPFLIQRPIPVLPATSEVTHPPTIEPEPFLYLLGKQRLLEAQHRCYDRMQKLPPYQGEGKRNDVCECVFQTSGMQKLPPYQGEGKRNDVCECVFQTSGMQKLPPYQGEGKKKDVCVCVCQCLFKLVSSADDLYKVSFSLLKINVNLKYFS